MSRIGELAVGTRTLCWVGWRNEQRSICECSTVQAYVSECSTVQGWIRFYAAASFGMPQLAMLNGMLCFSSLQVHRARHLLGTTWVVGEAAPNSVAGGSWERLVCAGGYLQHLPASTANA